MDYNKEEHKEPGWDAVALDDARKLGAILREQYNMQPAAVAEKDDFGVMQAPLIQPPPSIHSIDCLKELGKGSMIH